MNERVKADLNEQIKLVLSEYRCGNINIGQVMRLIDMVFGDYYDFHPEDHPYYEERKRKESHNNIWC